MRTPLFLAALLFSAAAHAQLPLINHDPRGPVSRDMEIPREQGYTLPAFPEESNLIAFDPGVRTTMKFYIDAASISVGEDQVVRYTLVVQGDGDARNVLYEGVRCKTDERKTYAFGQRDGTWSEARNPEWEPYRYDAMRWALYRDFFCPMKGPIQTAEEGVEALRNGIHPLVQQFKPN